MISRRASDVTFLGLFGLFFLVCTALTIRICSTMALMDVMPMSGASDTVPAAIGVLVLAVGVFQFSAWKSRHLNCCRAASAIRKTDGPFRHGLRLGMHCIACCSNLTLLLLVVGVMDLRLMLLVTVAMTAERLAGGRGALAIGRMVAGAGLFLIARAIGMSL